MSDLNSATRDADASAVRSGPRSRSRSFAASTPASSAPNSAEGMLLGISPEEIDALVAEEVLEVATSRRNA